MLSSAIGQEDLFPVTSGDRAREDEIRPREGRHPLEYWSMLYRWRWLVAATALLPAGAALVRALATPPSYQATAEILIGRQAPQVLEFREVVQLDSQGWGDEYHLTQLKLLESRGLARQAVEKLHLTGEPEFAGALTRAADGSLQPTASFDQTVDVFAGRVSARRLEHSQVISVTFEAGRPELAALGANTVAEIFIEQAVRARSDAVADATSWLSTELAQQRGKVEDAERALRRLAEETGIVNFEERRMLLDQKLKQLGANLNEVQARRLQSEGLYRQMGGAKDLQNLSAVRDSRVFQELRVDLERLEQREAGLLAGRYLEQHPDVVKVRTEIAQARLRLSAEAQRIVKAVENDYLTTVAQEQNIRQAVEAAKAEALDLNRRGLPYEALKRDLEASQTVLNSLLARSKQTDVAQELRASPVRIVDRAPVPRRPVRPRPRRDTAIALLLGLGAGVAVALLLEHFDTRLKTPRDIRVHLGAPLLSVVPEEAQDPSRLVLLDAGRGGPFAESYRVLRAAFDPLWPGEGCRAICIVSTAPREGKSLTAVNLAASLAARGEPVLLVDGDLRRPEADRMLGGRRSPGLTDVLAGHVQVLDAVQTIEGTSLRLLASGSATPSPADVLNPTAVKGLLAALRGHFRWVVIDTTPLGAAPDALNPAALSDGVVLVVGAEMTHEGAAARTLERLRDVGCHIVGVVLNRARVERYPYEYGARFGHYSGHYAAEAADGGGAELAAAK